MSTKRGRPPVFSQEDWAIVRFRHSDDQRFRNSGNPIQTQRGLLNKLFIGRAVAMFQLLEVETPPR